MGCVSFQSRVPLIERRTRGLCHGGGGCRGTGLRPSRSGGQTLCLAFRGHTLMFKIPHTGRPSGLPKRTSGARCSQRLCVRGPRWPGRTVRGSGPHSHGSSQRPLPLAPGLLLPHWPSQGFPPPPRSSSAPGPLPWALCCICNLLLDACVCPAGEEFSPRGVCPPPPTVRHAPVTCPALPTRLSCPLHAGRGLVARRLKVVRVSLMGFPSKLLRTWFFFPPAQVQEGAARDPLVCPAHPPGWGRTAGCGLARRRWWDETEGLQGCLGPQRRALAHRPGPSQHPACGLRAGPQPLCAPGSSLMTRCRLWCG